ncbi:MAG TPA: Ig-like domain-containing protein, partial [Kofleriaceae bacterium]|nr:Ig-like domain-containing protein [Kofleriaceae bacterium]
QVLPAQNSTPTVVNDIKAVAQSRIIYLNKNGVTLSPGDNDSRTNKSTIVNQTTSIAAWNVSAANWQSTVDCFRDLFARFDVTVVDSDPGNVPHMEAVFGGSPTQVGLPNNVAGVSPFTLDCSIIENSVVFTFTGAFNFTPREACEIMAQEVAHSYGLDHELLASDPMTYLQYNGNRAFQDQTASCGEDTTRVCGINGSQCRPNQNSVALLRERLGTSDAVAPTMDWSSPANNATVPPGFEVKASGSDNIAVTGAVLKIDGAQTDMQAGAGPFTFVTSTTLAEGTHTVVVEISDGKNIKSETRTVTVQKGAPPPDDTGSGGSSGTGGGDTGGLDNGDIVGGCSAGGGQATALLALGLLGVLTRRRRR